MAEEIDLLTSTTQHQLPAMSSTARKSRREVGKFGVLTTKDASRKIAVRKQKEDQAGARKAKKQRDFGLESTPKIAAGEDVLLEMSIES